MFLGFLSSMFYNPWLLLGLVVLAIPPIIHLLNRRRYDIIDWGAMQFLKISEVTRRRLMLEEVLLMLLRMGLLGVLVVALAGPFLPTPVAVTAGAVVAVVVVLLVAAAVALAFQAVRRRPWFLGLLLLLLAVGGGWVVWNQYNSPSLWLGSLEKGMRPSRDVVLVFDGSASMSATDETGTKTPLQAAREWALAYLDELQPGDSVAVLQAREQVLGLVGELSMDLKRARERIRNLPAPAGSCNWPEAVKAAHALLETSQREEREIVLLGDGQKFSWADPDTLFRWELLAGELGYNRPELPVNSPRPRIWAVPLGAAQPQNAGKESPVIPNWALTPLRGNRPVVPVDREVTFQTDIVMVGQKEYVPPHKLRLEVDGKPVRDLSPPQNVKLDNGKVPLSFSHKFGTAGSHLVSLILDADKPAESRPEGYVLRDRVPGDNRQDYSVEVLSALPVLLVDGDRNPTPPANRGTDFLRDALSPARDRNPVVQSRVVGITDFTADLLTGETRPRVLVLANVAQLSSPQQEAVNRFLADGGGVLVTLGDRVEAERYNADLYRDGDGWLPARLDGPEGDEAKPREGVHPDPATFTHPTLELFRRLTVGGLGEVRFPRWWKVTTPGKHSPGVTVGVVRSPTTAYPFLVERAYQSGRVLLCSVPLDNTWGTNLPDLPAFVPLAHELVYYLAGARSAEFNLKAGQPLRYRLDKETAVDAFQLQPPTGAPIRLTSEVGKPESLQAQVLPQDRGALLVFDGMRAAGVWRLMTPENSTIYYCVQPDARESDLTPASEEDREKVKKFIPVTYQTDREAIHQAAATSTTRTDLWLYMLLGLIALLCSEVWMTRRMVKNR
jgi:hypothetical protein